jgi:hypothetical protein
MTRKSTTITIAEDGRDKGKSFVLTELPADQGERWFIRALLALSASGANVTPDMIAGGAASFATFGITALMGVPWEMLEPLLDEMWECVQYKHTTQGIPLQAIDAGVNSQIEEVKTRFALRVAVLQLHMGFSIPEVSPNSGVQAGESEASSQPTFRGLLLSWYRKVWQH